MRSLLDVSMLLALADPKHTHHDQSGAWIKANAHIGWASCPLTQNGFLRVASQTAHKGYRPIGEALVLLTEWISQPEHEFWPDDLSLLDDARISRAQEAQVEVELDAEHVVRAQARVVRQQHPESPRGLDVPGLGLAFESLPDPAARAIATLVESKAA